MATSSTVVSLLALLGLASAFSSSRQPSTTLRYFSGSAFKRACPSLGSSASPEGDGPAAVSVDDAATDVPDLPPVPAMSKRLFLVRHGEVINPGGDRPVYYGAMDVPLSPLGEREATAAASYLGRFDLQRVACSPLSRAVFGAGEVLQMQSGGAEGLGVTVYDGFMELDRGSWCGRTKEEIGTEAMDRFDACDESVTPEGGESYPALKNRVLRARDELLDITDCGRASTVVSHLQVTRSMLSDAMGIPTEEMVGLNVSTASVSCVDYCSVTREQTIHFQSFKPDAGLEKSKDGAN